jgi:hypothetical protein
MIGRSTRRFHFLCNRGETTLIDRLKKFAGHLVRLVLPVIVTLQSLLTGCDDRAKWRGVATNGNEQRDGGVIHDTSAEGSANEPRP